MESSTSQVKKKLLGGGGDICKAADKSKKELVTRRCRREKLVAARLFVAKLSLIVSTASILLMIVNTQLILVGVYSTCSAIALDLKGIISGLTLLLLILIWVYNYLQLEIFRNVRCISSRRMAIQVNPQRSLLLILETIITLPHPLPVCLPPTNTPQVSPFFNEHEGQETNFTTDTNLYSEDFSISNSSNTTTSFLFPVNESRINQLDSVFAMLMFLRLYHVARFSVLRSKLFRTMLSYSLGALAHTKYNFLFIFKSYMAIYQGYFLATLALAFTFVTAWCIYICDKDLTKYGDALWVVCITFFTVGYGDISPVSRYSQVLAVLTGFSGMFFMGISVTILSRYLQLTYDEYCMLSFFVEADLQKERREVSARIVQAAWKQYKEGKNVDAITRYKSQRNLMKAFHMKKNIDYQKITGRERREKQVPLYDMKEQMKKLTIRTDHVIKREASLEVSIETTRQKLHQMQEKLSQLCKLVQKDKRRSTLTVSSSLVEGTEG
ncbi:small conductance calcium-activated potassium channel protein 2-like [Watersipora subatra]|uniref:small conductance calcium-activated potassium channel protein 2-like n=1 Tax=Watersipora subatra TaxID=2589382 RepID=UPI00355B2FE5